MITATRRIQFCAGHRVMNHDGKCKNLHGHNYVVLVEASAAQGYDMLDGLGRVIDFSVLKERIGGWIEREWDHGFLVFDCDTDALAAILAFEDASDDVTKHRLVPFNPTAENIAKHLLDVVCPEQLAGTGVEVVRVTVWETENCFAVARKVGAP